MSVLAHLRWVFEIAGGKNISCGIDLLKDSGTFAQADLDDIVADAVTVWSAGGVTKQWHPSTTKLLGCEAYAYDVVTNPSGVPNPYKKQLTLGPRSQTSNVVGTGTGLPCPPQVTLALSFKGAASTKRTRGRMYLPPPILSIVDAQGQISQTVANQIEQAWGGDGITTIVENALGAGGLHHVVVSLQEATLATEVTDYIVKRRVDTQRRRLSRAHDVP